MGDWLGLETINAIPALYGLAHRSKPNSDHKNNYKFI